MRARLRPQAGSPMPPDLVYDVPLRGGSMLARLILPTDLTVEEAQRISRFVQALPLPILPLSDDEPAGHTCTEEKP